MKHVAAALALLLVLPAFANDQTDVVKLKNGRFITGTVVVDEADKEGFKVQRWDTGGTILVKWTQITEAERNRILNKAPEATPAGAMIDGVVAMTATRDVIGVLKKEDATQLLIKTKDSKTPVPVPKSALLRPHELRPIAESEAYSPDEMVDLRLAAASEKDYAALRDLGRFAARLRLYERAKELYQKAAAADATKKDEIEEIIAANEVLIKEGKAAEMLKQINALIEDVEFLKAAELAKKLLAEFADTEVAKQNKDLAVTIDRKAKDFEARKAEYLAKEVPEMYKNKRGSLLSTYSSSKYKINEAMNQANKLDDTIVADLAKKLKSTPEEIQAAWAKREMKPKTVGYGDGSWIVKGGQDGGLDTDAKTQPQQQKQNNNNGGFGFDGGRGGNQNKNNQNQNKPIDLGRKLETKDQWWANASSSDRRNFLEAEYAKNSSAVKKEIKTKKCSVCNGEGIRKETRMGVACDCKCTRCHGAKEDEIIVYQ